MGVNRGFGGGVSSKKGAARLGGVRRAVKRNGCFATRRSSAKGTHCFTRRMTRLPFESTSAMFSDPAEKETPVKGLSPTNVEMRPSSVKRGLAFQMRPKPSPWRMISSPGATDMNAIQNFPIGEGVFYRCRLANTMH